MAIKPDSRYATGNIVPMEDGTVAVFRRFPINQRRMVTYYMWEESARLDRLARLFGSPSNWWKIMDANPDRENPWEFTPGDLIRIPIVESKRNA